MARVVLFALSIVVLVLAGALYNFVRQWETEGYYRKIRFSETGDRILSLDSGTEIRLWNAETGKEIRTMRKPYAGGGADHLAFSPDGHLAVSGGTDGVILWDLETGKMLHLFENTRPAPPLVSGPCVEFSPDGRFILSGNSELDLVLWNVETYFRERKFAIPPDDKTTSTSKRDIRCMDFSPDGRFVVTAGGRLILRNVETGEILRVFSGIKKNLIAVAISNDNRFVVAASSNSRVMKWSIESGQMEKSLHLNHFAESIALSPDCRFVVSGGYQGLLTLWDLERETSLFSLESTEGKGVLSVAVGPDGRKVAAGLEGSLKLWDMDTGKEIFTFKRKATLPLILQALIWKYVRI